MLSVLLSLTREAIVVMQSLSCYIGLFLTACVIFCSYDRDCKFENIKITFQGHHQLTNWDLIKWYRYLIINSYIRKKSNSGQQDHKKKCHHENQTSKGRPRAPIPWMIDLCQYASSNALMIWQENTIWQKKQSIHMFNHYEGRFSQIVFLVNIMIEHLANPLST